MTMEGIIQSLNNYLNTFEYGVLIQDTIYPDMDNAPFWKYRTLTISQMDEYRVGICWDFVNYQHYILKSNDIPHKNYIFIKRLSDDPDDIVTHTFTVVEDSGHYIWIESSGEPYKGVNYVASYQDVLNILNHEYNPSLDEYEVHEYDADNLIGLTTKEFFDAVIPD